MHPDRLVSPAAVMALLTVLTPVLAVVLCFLIGLMLLRSQDKETTSPGKTEGAPKADFRPWVDQDLQDDTEIKGKEEGESCTAVLLTGWNFYLTSKLSTCGPQTQHKNL